MTLFHTINRILQIGICLVAVSLSAQVPLNPQSDFNGDSISDFFGRNLLSGKMYLWFMGQNGITGFVALPGNIGSNVELHVGDLNGDGKADLFGRNTLTGELYAWLMNGTTFLDFKYVPGNIGNNIELHLTDMDGDGQSDLFGRDDLGSLYVWKIKNFNVVDFYQLPGNIGKNMQLYIPNIISVSPSVDPSATITVLPENLSNQMLKHVYGRDLSNGIIYRYVLAGKQFLSYAVAGYLDLNAELLLGDINGDKIIDIVSRDKNTGELIAQITKSSVMVCSNSSPTGKCIRVATCAAPICSGLRSCPKSKVAVAAVQTCVETTILKLGGVGNEIQMTMGD